MKLRVVKTKKEIKLLCPNGSILKADKSVLTSLLTGFRHPRSFRGTDEYWSNTTGDMNEVRGETLAYIDEKNALVVLNEDLFLSIIAQVEYVSASEYADMHKKSRASIKRLCADGRISGVYKTSSGWLIPKNAPYPERKSREIKQHT